ncbi:hypothetical protein SDC9_74877 [bioreactor metagenome]|uniref:Flavodoxin-like domain-containing protein n=1 Tax=bioreactor metagenome TaxID=1076179 RepID=A0A644YIE7_9ZZZZ
MKTVILSYSYTGNNARLAESIAQQLQIPHLPIIPQKNVSMKTIVLDVLFNRTPKVHPVPSVLKDYDLVIMAAPIWMGLIASPLRSYFKYLKSGKQDYAFLSVSGGSADSSIKIAKELRKRLTRDPLLILDQHIADLLDPAIEPTAQTTMAYKLSEEDLVLFRDRSLSELTKIVKPD